MNLQPKKCPLEKIHADVVLSVGTNCRTAHHLGTYNLRKEANPLDWMTCFSLDTVYHLFQNDFKDFFIESFNEGKFDQHHLRVKDLRTNMISIHHFNHKDNLKKQSQEINSQAIKRWLKIKEKITNAKNIVFVYNGSDSIEQITIFLKSINNLFGLEKKYYFIQIKHDKNKKWNEIEFYQYGITKNITFYQYVGNDTNITDIQANSWHGNQFLWGEAMKNIVLKENEIPKEIIKFKGAIQIVKNHLSYKLGESMIVNSKTLFGYIKMPFILTCIAVAHKEKNKTQKGKLSIALDKYDDYQEALQIKKCFTYKLGQALIKASNNKWGGGYFKMFFEIRKLKKDFLINKN